jgi:CelD/BcsL family acetyltransferase involved in cellulose biosynthesis
MRSVHAPASPALTLEINRHDGPLAALEGVWTRLDDPAHPGAAFRSFPWISSWWSEASTSRDAEVLVAHRGDKVVGLLPLYAERTPLGGRRLRFMGDGIVGSDWLGAIACPDDRRAVSQAFADALLRTRADELQLDDLGDDDPLVIALTERAPHPSRVVVEPRYICPSIRASGSFEQFLSGLPDGIGAQFHRRRKWLEKRPGHRVETLTSPADVERGLGVLFDLHRQRWALEGGSDAIDGPKVERFHVAAARALAELGWARMYLLHVEGAPRAALYGWQHGDRLVFYQAGHEPAWRPRSVGTVLLGLVIKSAFDQGLAEFDFLRGDEPYKLKWATGFRKTVRVRVRGPGLRPLLDHEARKAMQGAKATARALLSPKAVARLRAWRKQLTREERE